VLQLTRLSGPAFALNPDLIERAEATPDTVVTLVNGSKYVIRESLEELIELIRQYRVSLVAAAQTSGFGPTGGYPPHPAHLSAASTAQPNGRTAAHRRDAAGTVVVLHPGEE
jgi:flagellar protein FlbD